MDARTDGQTDGRTWATLNALPHSTNSGGIKMLVCIPAIAVLHLLLVSPTPTISTVVLEYMIYVSVPVQCEVFHKQVGIHRVTQVNMGVL